MPVHPNSAPQPQKSGHGSTSVTKGNSYCGLQPKENHHMRANPSQALSLKPSASERVALPPRMLAISSVPFGSAILNEATIIVWCCVKWKPRKSKPGTWGCPSRQTRLYHKKDTNQTWQLGFPFETSPFVPQNNCSPSTTCATR